MQAHPGQTIKIAWEPATGPVAGYQLYQVDEDTGAEIQVAQTEGPSWDLVVTGERTGKRLTFKARAFDENGNVGPFGPPSDVIEFTTAPLGAPGKVIVTIVVTVSVQTSVSG